MGSGMWNQNENGNENGNLMFYPGNAGYPLLVD
jgi:hypothetical protein